METQAEHQAGAAPQWDGVLRREGTLTVRAIDEERRAVDFLVSTDSIDAHGDIVEQDWDLTRYRKNPIVLWAHRRWGQPGEIIVGRAESVKVGKEGLEATFIFARAEESEVGDQAFRLVKGGFLRATSVGFRPHKVRLDTLDDEREVYRLSGNELMEISLVPIPSNPDAVAKDATSIRDQEREWLRKKATGRAAAPEQLPLLEEENTMTAEEKKALEDAKVAARAAEERAESINKDLKAAQAETKAAEARADAAEKRAEKAEAEVKKAEEAKVVAEITAFKGKKLKPTEVDEHIELAKEIGLDRVKRIVEGRPDLPQTQEIDVKTGDEPRTSVSDDAPVEQAGQAFVSRALGQAGGNN